MSDTRRRHGPRHGQWGLPESPAHDNSEDADETRYHTGTYPGDPFKAVMDDLRFEEELAREAKMPMTARRRRMRSLDKRQQ